MILELLIAYMAGLITGIGAFLIAIKVIEIEAKEQGVLE